MPHVRATRRVYLDLTGQIRFVEEPGRCETYWWLYQAGRLEEASTHLEICSDCRDWLDRCEEISRQTYPHDVPLEDEHDRSYDRIRRLHGHIPGSENNPGSILSEKHGEGRADGRH